VLLIWIAHSIDPWAHSREGRGTNRQLFRWVHAERRLAPKWATAGVYPGAGFSRARLCRMATELARARRPRISRLRS